ncbi:MAG: T9SS type A sorting domain-containing protein [Ignavibacteriae bacterium]|nr:T9SS type A sorting domain-containing protein [Ignavibacteriota bacterium]
MKFNLVINILNFLSRIKKQNYLLLRSTLLYYKTLTISALLLSPQIFAQGSYKTLNFDGSNDYINLGNINTDGLSELTIEAWVKHSDSNDDRVVCKSTGTARADHIFSLGLANNIIRIRINGVGDFDGTTTLSIDIWYHVAFSYDGSSIKIYLNGVLEASHSAAYGNINISSQVVTIANINTVDNRYFLGNIDDIRIWNVVRSETEIRTYMCQNISSSDPDLIGCWRLNSDNGTTAVDETGTNNGTLINMSDDDWIWSGASIGDASSYDYTGVPSTPSSYSVTLGANDNDTFTATGESGTFSGIQVYRTDVAAQRTNSTIPTAWKTDAQKYWGVFAIGTSPTYDIVYSYDENSGLWNEGFLALGMRNNNNDDSWEDLTATLDEVSNTLIKNSQINLEYTLAETNYVLPIELILFQSKVIGNNIELKWVTETEVNNLGFTIERKDPLSNKNWEEIKFIKGSGVSNSKKYYSFVDNAINKNGKYYYRLKQISLVGSFEYSDVIEVDVGVNQPFEFKLSQNFPNPFNPTTTIEFTIPIVETGNLQSVQLTVFNAIGEQVAELVSKSMEAGKYNVVFNASKLNSGVYFYKLKVENYLLVRKMMFLK